jgi:uncharacterized protein YcbK (DUF882 family)
MRGSLLVVFGLAALGASTLGAPEAMADVQHTVAKGHTIEAIANRYHVSAKSIIEANKLKDVKHLKVGDVLTIPKVDPPKKHDDGKGEKGEKGKAKVGKDGKPEHGPTNYAAKPKTPGVVHIKRLATSEEQDLRVSERGAKVSSSTLKTMEKLLRSPGGASHPIEARLVSLLGVVSNHFGSRKIEVISGFRPYTPTQYTAHSNHNHGKAVDFRVVGVPNEVVRDFCRTLKNVGCGYYPNSTFVHMDARETSAFWIDYAKPGEPPHYNAPDVDADEGTSDVHGASAGANTPPPPAPAPEAVPGASEGEAPVENKPADQ